MPENIPMSKRKIDPAASVQRFRRLVTGLDERGRSTFLSDELCPHMQVVADTPTFVATDFWRHENVPVDNSGPMDDGVMDQVSISPPATGSVCRVVEFPPDSHWDDGGEIRSRMFHSTASLDYVVVLRGEIWAVLDAAERKMTAGDVLIQRGTNHSWSNRSESSCVVLFVLIGGTAVRPC
ncbi:cupin domain-containing protein [Streptomyces diastatochromogenes]|uniref:Cupin 2 conserved barrel domain-containing protein n=1 Tax=Streptomyces diastatochromogenes TaxID=42236 RepID=A0A233S3V2_STRDA|nr:cupin domain-containing protein [Streptomyces diastatochromogenes]OXY90224.1 hypothetical protein BEK98_35050 [Streptomyces diastatochromogenes]